ncbi:MAG: DNA-binding transcriptional LysR family regulator, partial [Saprospiraceae bacterium]
MSNQLELRHIKYFLAVAEELHFRKAAERLFISQPGLSRQIKQMEEELGLQLFERHNRKVTLTQAGTYLRDEYQTIIKSIDKVINHAQLIHKGQEGELKIGYIGSAMHKIIPSFLLDIKKKYPNIHVNFQEMDNQVQTAKILDQDIDIGFVRMDRVPRGVEIRPIYEETFSLVLPKNHTINKSNFKDLSQ